jgi:choline dehydrogenase-like flavoprotein
VLAGGGINSPALLLRSDAPDPHSGWANALSCTW